MKPIFSAAFRFLFLSLMPMSALASPDAPCDMGFQRIDTRTYALIAAQEMPPGEPGKLVSYIEQCVGIAPSLSEGKRSEFLELVGRLLTRVESVQATLALEAARKPDDARLVTKLKDMRSLRDSLELAQYQLSERLPLDRGWDRDFSFAFYLGYEGTSVSGFKEKGTARAGMMIYNQLTGPLKKGSHFGLHVFSNVLMTSSAEQTGQATQQTSGIESAIEMDLNVFVPVYTKAQSVGLLAVGPIVMGGLRKPDNINEFTRKYMAGVRLAHSPESYFDLLYGRTERVQGKRLELRGQLPVSKLLNGNLFVGGAVNVSANEEKNNNDTLRLYVTWQVSIADIFGTD